MVSKNPFTNVPLSRFDYDAYWKGRVEIRSRLLEREAIFLEWIKPGSSVLDIAVGTSALPKVLQDTKRCQVTAWDINERIVAAQRQRGLTAHAVDIADRCLEIDRVYDYLIASETLEHLALPEAVLERFKPHAKFFILSVPNAAFYRSRLRLCWSGRFLKQWASHPAEHLRYWSHRDFLDWLISLGFEVVESRASNGLDLGPLKLYNFWLNLLGHQICYLARPSQGQVAV